MPCPTADLKLALSSFLRVQFHGCHFALGVGAFLTPQCGFYKFHQPAPAPSSSSNTTTRRRCLHTVCCWWLRSGIYRHFCRPKMGHLSRLVAIGMLPFGWMAELYSMYQASAIDHVYTMANRGLFKHAWNWQASTPKWTHLTRRRSKTSELNVPIAITSCCLVY